MSVSEILASDDLKAARSVVKRGGLRLRASIHQAFDRNKEKVTFQTIEALWPNARLYRPFVVGKVWLYAKPEDRDTIMNALQH